jgi:phosphoribosylglycinamide formyltransferase-1
MDSAQRLRIAVFASGKGSNAQAILHAVSQGYIPHADVVLVLSDRTQAGALDIARSCLIPAVHCSRLQYEDDMKFVEALAAILHTYKVNFIALAGYLKKIPSAIINEYRNRIVNIHPALLPAFGGPGMFGMHVHEAVIASGARMSGATVHIVDEEYDKGPIVLQSSVEVHPGDTPEALAARVLEIEHQLYPEALKLFAEGRVRIEGRQVHIQTS